MSRTYISPVYRKVQGIKYQLALLTPTLVSNQEWRLRRKLDGAGGEDRPSTKLEGECHHSAVQRGRAHETTDPGWQVGQGKPEGLELERGPELELLV